MTILSAQLLLSNRQAITATALSTNVIDIGAPGTPYGAQGPLGRDIGKGNPIPILVQVVETFNEATSVTVSLEVSANSAMTSSTVVASQTIPLAQLVAGKKINLQYLPNGINQRYLAVRYTVTGTAPTAGRMHAGISMGNQTNIND